MIDQEKNGSGGIDTAETSIALRQERGLGPQERRQGLARCFRREAAEPDASDSPTAGRVAIPRCRAVDGTSRDRRSEARDEANDGDHHHQQPQSFTVSVSEIANAIADRAGN